MKHQRIKNNEEKRLSKHSMEKQERRVIGNETSKNQTKPCQKTIKKATKKKTKNKGGVGRKEKEKKKRRESFKMTGGQKVAPRKKKTIQQKKQLI